MAVAVAIAIAIAIAAVATRTGSETETKAIIAVIEEAANGMQDDRKVVVPWPRDFYNNSYQDVRNRFPPPQPYQQMTTHQNSRRHC